MVGDMFHRGHLNLLERASKLGEVIVGVPTNWQIEEYTKKVPLGIPFEDRLRIVSACKFVSWAFGYATDKDMTDSIQYIKPDLYVRGDDWKDFPGKKELVKQRIKIKYLPYTTGISSTKLRG